MFQMKNIINLENLGFFSVGNIMIRHIIRYWYTKILHVSDIKQFENIDIIVARLYVSTFLAFWFTLSISLQWKYQWRQEQSINSPKRSSLKLK